MREFLVKFCLLLLKIFFRRIEVVGEDLLPKDGALVFVGNHQNGLVDPLFILCLSGRRVSFLAKEPLFRMPFVSIFVKAFECLPVYRATDGADPQKNREMMQAAASLLSRGNALALFPEGVSHSDPSLKRFRSGAARIALSARALSGAPVRIVPAALYYEEKDTFRSRAVLAFGEPLEVPAVDLDESGNSPIEAGTELTATIADAVEALMPTAETAEGLVLAEQSERLIGAAIRDNPEKCPTAVELSRQEFSQLPSLASRMRLRRRLIDHYGRLTESDPERVSEIVQRIEGVRDDLEQRALPIDAPASGSGSLNVPLWFPLFGALLLLPGALVGILIHAPAYQLVRLLSLRMASQSTDIAATIKLVAGLLFFPITWVGIAAFVYSKTSLPLALISLPALALSAWLAITFLSLVGRIRRRVALKRNVLTAEVNWDELCDRRAKLAEEIGAILHRN